MAASWSRTSRAALVALLAAWLARAMVAPAPKKMTKVSEFAAKVHDVVRAIPAGRVSSYGAVAKAAGAGTARAVGGAMRTNPFTPTTTVDPALIVPWHRVVGSDRRLTGFSGQTEGEQLSRKRRLLEAEGVDFDDDGRVAKKSFLGTLLPTEGVGGTDDDAADQKSPRGDDATQARTTETTTAWAATAATLRATALEMVRARGPSKTCWPSEIARRVGTTGGWRALMPATHALARQLAREGLVELTRGGAVVDDVDALRGIYRMRVARMEWGRCADGEIY